MNMNMHSKVIWRITIILTYLPTIINSTSDDLVRILLQISIVKIVLALLKIDVKDDMRADIMTAIIKPLRPLGISFNTSLG